MNLIKNYDKKMLTLDQIIKWYDDIKREIISLYHFVAIITDEYHARDLPIPRAAKNGYKVTAREINDSIDEFKKEIAAATSGRPNAVLYGPMLFERDEFMMWLDEVYDLSPLVHVSEVSPF